VLLAVDDHHGVTVVVLLVFPHTELVHQRMNAILTRPDPRAPAIDPGSVGTVFRERATADPVTRLEQGHRPARPFQPQGGRQTCESRTDHAKIDV